MKLPTFVLIHGFGHNSASWILLIEALARRGAPAVAVDLPCEDPNAGLRDYAKTVLSKTALLDDVVVVGHSMGGMTAPIVAGERPVRELVLLCSAAIPMIGLSLAAQLAADPDMTTTWSREHRLEREILPDEEKVYPPLRADDAKESYYHDCQPRHQDWAISQLRRQALSPITEVSPLEDWPQVPMRGIYGRDDPLVSLDWARRVFRDRFGIRPAEIPGGHSPFLTRPAELAETLIRPHAS